MNVDQVASCVVAGISAHGNVRGVYLNRATNNEVRNSNLADNGYGVYGDYASSNTISNNVATGEKGYGNTLGDGIYLFYSDSNTITENDLSGNHVYGISLYHSSNNTISTNTISKNEQIGVRLRECDNNTLKFNTISGNAQQGILIIETTGNQIYLNSFINQPNDLTNSPETKLDSPQKMMYTYNGSAQTGYMGNYYSDYKGDDKNGDGISDVATSFGDSHPLVQPVDHYGSISIATATPSPSAKANVSTNTITSSTEQANNASKTPGFEVGGTLAAIAILTLFLKRSYGKTR